MGVQRCMQQQSGHLFCFGLGYTAQVLTRRLQEAGWQVSGTCRSAEKAQQLSRQGMRALVFNEHMAISELAVERLSVTHVLSSIPPGAQGDPAILAGLEERLQGHTALRWMGYLSTFGVYGDRWGAWIDETDTPQPQSALAHNRLLAEEQWLKLGRKWRVATHVFRLPGIYGPDGRNQISALEAGKARRIVKPGQVFNRIHVDDLAAVVEASMQRIHGSEIYNVCDDEPAPASDVVTYAAELMGMAPPPLETFDAAEMSDFARHFYAECKRVRNDRIKRELGINLRYPNYREGLNAIAAGRST